MNTSETDRTQSPPAATASPHRVGEETEGAAPDSGIRIPNLEDLLERAAALGYGNFDLALLQEPKQGIAFALAMQFFAASTPRTSGRGGWVWAGTIKHELELLGKSDPRPRSLLVASGYVYSGTVSLAAVATGFAVPARPPISYKATVRLSSEDVTKTCIRMANALAALLPPAAPTTGSARPVIYLPRERAFELIASLTLPALPPRRRHRLAA